MAKSPALSNSTALRDETVLRRVRHFGSARNGLREWRLQRLTALALIPLALYSFGWAMMVPVEMALPLKVIA